MLFLLVICFYVESYYIWLITTWPYLMSKPKPNGFLKWVLNPITMFFIMGISWLLTTMLTLLFVESLIIGVTLFLKNMFSVIFLIKSAVNKKFETKVIKFTNFVVLILSGIDLFYLKRTELSLGLFIFSVYMYLTEIATNNKISRLFYFELSSNKYVKDHIDSELQTDKWVNYSCNYFAKEIKINYVDKICCFTRNCSVRFPLEPKSNYIINSGNVQVIEESDSWVVKFQCMNKSGFSFRTKSKSLRTSNKLATSLQFWEDNSDIGILDKIPPMSCNIEEIEYTVCHCISLKEFSEFINDDNFEAEVVDLDLLTPILVLGKNDSDPDSLLDKTFYSNFLKMDYRLKEIIINYSKEFKSICNPEEISFMLIKNRRVIFKPICFGNSEFKVFCSDLNRLLGLSKFGRNYESKSKIIKNCSYLKPSQTCLKYLSEIKTKKLVGKNNKSVNSLSENVRYNKRREEKKNRMVINISKESGEQQPEVVEEVLKSFDLIFNEEINVKKLNYCPFDIGNIALEVHEVSSAEILDDETVKKLEKETDNLHRMSYETYKKVLKKSLKKGESSEQPTSKVKKAEKAVANFESGVKKLLDHRKSLFKLSKHKELIENNNKNVERFVDSFVNSQKSDMTFQLYKKVFKNELCDLNKAKEFNITLQNKFSILSEIKEMKSLDDIKMATANYESQFVKPEGRKDRGRKEGGKTPENEQELKDLNLKTLRKLKQTTRSNESSSERNPKMETVEDSGVMKFMESDNSSEKLEKLADSRRKLMAPYLDDFDIREKLRKQLLNKIVWRSGKRTKKVFQKTTISEIITALLMDRNIIGSGLINKEKLKLSSSVWKEWKLHLKYNDENSIKKNPLIKRSMEMFEGKFLNDGLQLRYHKELIEITDENTIV